MKLLKAIIGDICGSYYELNRIKVNERPSNLMLESCRFTDDTVCTIAIAEAILKDPKNPDFDESLRKYVRLYPKAGYGQRFIYWAFNEEIGNSYGNGCCMRQYPISLYYSDYHTRKVMLAKSCAGSHNHPDSYLYTDMLDDMINRYLYLDDEITTVMSDLSLNFNIEEYRKTYKFDCTCSGSVPQAISIGLTSTSYEDCIKNAIYLGGDMDTIACMAGMVTKYDPPKELEKWAFNKLPEEMKNVVIKFEDEINKSH